MVRLKKQKESKNIVDKTGEDWYPAMPKVFEQYENMLLNKGTEAQRAVMFDALMRQAVGPQNYGTALKYGGGPAEALFLKALEEQGQPGYLTPLRKKKKK